MGGRGAGSTGAKRTPYERETDLMYIHGLKLRRLPPAEILRRLQRRQVERAKDAALELGMSPDEALVVAQAAAISHQSMAKDFRTVKARLADGIRHAGEALVRDRMAELELDRQAAEMGEGEAWSAWERSQQPGVQKTKVEARGGAAPVDALGQPVEGESGDGLALSSRTEQTTNRDGDARFLQQALAWAEMRMRICAQQFELACMIGAEPEIDFAALRRGDGQEAARAALVQQLEWFYRAEARFFRRDVDEQRIRLLGALAGSGRKAPQGTGGGGPKKGQDDGFVIELLALPAAAGEESAE